MLKHRPANATAVDVFCGAGGLTRGLLDARIRVVAGYDTDEKCKFPYEHNNPGAKFYKRCVTRLTGRCLARHYPKSHIKILVGCAPCQAFSKYTQGILNKRDPKWTLLREFSRLIRELKPDIVSMENVIELRRYKIFQEFLAVLIDGGYHFARDPEKWTVDCADYGVPQRRRRLVIIASRLGPIEIIPPTHRLTKHRTVGDVLRKLPSLRAGQVCETDLLHRASSLSKRNLRRILASKPGGSWRDWPRHLKAKCHRAETGKSYPSVYGRMEWEKPSPTITTEFYGFGSGRFGHPRQHRALSLREGAILQSFPRWYKFAQEESHYNLKRMGKLIGNAVPVRLGTAIGKTITKHLAQYEK
ncbi:MAG TPA: DNA cytosine methyltransferase [Candidatus Acidoferrales bacterium]|nr:DNA cytosine methyltransferase [Candidatus Acidoferrales bacterium]